MIFLAYDLGIRLLPAFVTPTGIPYGTVNLRHGVPIGETEIASTAGAGSLFVEFDVLSSLTSDDRFGDAAFNAVQALYKRRSYFSLLGKHIHTGSGLWHESTSGVGSNADSFYEYLLKGHLLSHRSTLFSMFADTYHAIKRHVQVGDWFTEVDMFNGKTRRNRVENLQAFWPGMESILGLCDSAARLLNTFYAVWEDVGFLPEEFDQAAWLDNKVINDSWYPLRPELIESTYLQYRSTGDRTWLAAGSLFLDNLEDTRTDCGYASLSNIGSMQLTDNMPSYFLSETLKYLYLLFDEHNFVHDRPYIFSTEAHPFDPLQLPMRATSTSSGGLSGEGAQLHGISPKLPLKCQKGMWWTSSRTAYDPNYMRDQRGDPSYMTDSDSDDIKVVKGSVRQSTTLANSAKVASMLHSSSLRDLSDRDARKGQVSQQMSREYRRPSTCYDEDIQIVQPPETADFQADSTKDADMSRKVSINAEQLGDFEVTVYPDGFMVYSKNERDTLEITNIGERLVFVGYMGNSPSAKSKTVVGDRSGKTVTCTVSLTDRLGERLVGDEERSCSIGTFGPQSLPSSAVIGELHVPSEDHAKLCKPLELLQRTSRARVNQHASSAVTNNGKSKAKSWWSEWPSASSISTMLSMAYPKRIKRQSAQEGERIVLAKRGDCLFEEKAANAEAAGAAAIIVSNSEVRRVHLIVLTDLPNIFTIPFSLHSISFIIFFVGLSLRYVR